MCSLFNECLNFNVVGRSGSVVRALTPNAVIGDNGQSIRPIACEHCKKTLSFV